MDMNSLFDFSTRTDGPSARKVLALQLLFSVLFMVMAQMLYLAVSQLSNWDTSLLESGLRADASAGERWQMRLMLGLNHLFMFIAGGIVTVAMFYRSGRGSQSDWPTYLMVRKAPKPTTLGLGVLLMIVSMPLVLWLLDISKQFPLPEMFKMMEDDTEEMLKGLLVMDNGLELVANLVLIAMLPALGEELVFRGVVQQQFMRRLPKPWMAIALAAAVFSAIHLQFEGFLSRWLLGMVLGWLYWRTGNFWVPVLAHFFNNAFQVVGQYAYHKQVSAVDFEQDVHVPWQVALFSTLLMWAVMRLIRQEHPLREPLQETDTPTPDQPT